MLVAFWDPESDELASHRKGHIFEGLAERLCASAGYTQLALRAKHSSLEYDITGRSSLHAHPLFGEAKAHDASVAGQAISSFVGKLLPHAVQGQIDGLFISTSPFTAEARDYLETALPSLESFGISLRTLVGAEIPRFLADHAGHASEDHLRARVTQDHGPLVVLDSWLVCTPSGHFLAATCGPSSIAAATAYALFEADGSDLSLEGLDLAGLQRQIRDLAGLQNLTIDAPQRLALTVPERLPPIAAGAGSFDYRFPSPPEHFIGRTEPLRELAALADRVGGEGTAIRAAQVLSRSGVGKSSLLLKLSTTIPAPVVTIDGRSIRTSADVRLVVTAAVLAAKQIFPDGSALPEPRSLEETSAALQSLGEVLGNQSSVIVIQIDQFESMLTLPLVFDAILNLVETSTSQRLPMLWVFARKSDVAVTFDQGADIDLGRLNAISEAIRLEDFGPLESRQMFDQLEGVLEEKIRPDLANAIATFSAGFPWLHKRLCAHVLTMKHEGVSQRDLVQAGLRAEDLFEADLAGLTEQDRALLRRIASHLPASASELATHLEADITAGRLTEKLNGFLGAKLLRLSGDVYDAYNDVFKTYIVTDQVPFEARYVHRVAPRTTIRMLRRIAELGPMTLSGFQASIGGSAIANLNKLRELRLLGLIDPKAGRVELALETQEALEKGDLGELLRRRLRANGLVVRALDLVATNQSVSLEDLVIELRREMPQVEVADATWTLYAKTLASWLHFASLAQVEGDNVTGREIPADEALAGRAFTRGAFAAGTFLPSVRPDKVVGLMRLFGERERVTRDALDARFGKTRAPGLIQDALALDLVYESGGELTMGSQGRILREAGREIEAIDVAKLALTKPNVRALLEALSLEPLSETSQREIVARFGSAKWTDATWRWRLGLLRSWIVGTGLATSGREGLVRRMSDLSPVQPALW